MPTTGKRATNVATRIRSFVWLAVSVWGLAAMACSSTSGGKGDGGAGGGASQAGHPSFINLLVPAVARRVGSPLPVEVDVSGPDTVGMKTCVGLAAGPGVLRPVFPSGCGDAGGGTTGDGTFAKPVDSCVGLTITGNLAAGKTLAIYTPAGNETVITLVGALFADATCAGPPTASIAVSIDLTGPPVVDAGIDAPLVVDAGIGAPGTPDAASPDARTDAGRTVTDAHGSDGTHSEP